VHIEDFTLSGRSPVHVTLHRRLTVLSGCSADLREWVCQTLPGAFYGFDVASSVRWIGRSGERRVVAATDAIVPKITVIRAAQLDQPDRILDLLTMARVPATARAPGLVLLDDPFEPYNTQQTWESLDLLDRLSSRVQMLLLSNDPCVSGWAQHRQGRGQLSAIELVSDEEHVPAAPGPRRS
jgi:hypothetical protein